jgi:hypothetical protein
LASYLPHYLVVRRDEVAALANGLGSFASRH